MPWIAALAGLAAFAGTDVLILKAHIVDVEGGSIKRDLDVLVRDGRIAEIGSGLRTKAPASARIVDGTGRYLIPGLWDMHVHWYDEARLPLFTANGVTGARVMYGAPMHLDWKKRVAAGTLVGPRLVVASPIIDGKNPIWPGSWIADTPEKGRELVARVSKEGYDFAKVYSRLDRETYLAIADECKKQGIPFDGHVASGVTPLEASRAGQRCIEHLDKFLLTRSAKGMESLAALAQAKPEERFALMAQSKRLAAKSPSRDLVRTLDRSLRENKTWQCPTLVVNRNIGMLLDPALTNDPRMRYFGRAYAGQWDARNDFRFKAFKPEDYQSFRESYAAELKIVGQMHRAGVGIVAGTDALNPYCLAGFSLHDELALFVHAGLTPLESLRTATLNPSLMLGASSSRGTIAVGKDADLVLLAGNPLADIRNTTRIDAVVQGGRLYRRSDLDGFLAKAEALAKSGR